MRITRILAVLALAAALPTPTALAQSSVFGQPYVYTDRDGTGVMTFTPLSSQSTRYSYQQMQVTLTQGSQFFTGSGVYHSFVDDGANLEPHTLLSFSLLDNRGVAYFFQGRVSPISTAPTGSVSQVTSYSGGGTYWPTSSPYSQVSWSIQQQGSAPPSNAVVNSSPLLQNYWNRVTFSEAIGGVYYSTYNTNQGVDSTATWSGNLSGAGTYQVEVFIPRQATPSSLGRTRSATYQVYTSSGQALTLRISHQVSSSQWIPLGNFNLGSSYRVVLLDQTGEPTGTTSVTANAVRLTRQ